MKKIYYPLLLVLFLGQGAFLGAQNGQLKKGDKFYESLAYPLAIKHYEKGLKKERDLRSMERLADAYKNIGDPVGAEKWYAELVKTKGSAPINKFYYGETLMTNGKYTAARTWFEAYLQTGENPKRAATFIEACDFASEIKKDSSRYSIQEADFNVGESDFSPVITRKGMVYTSSRKRGFGSRFINMRDNERFFYDLYNVERSTNKKGYKVKPLKGKVNTKFHEGPAVFSKDGNTIFFTRSNFYKGEKGEDSRGINRLKIFQAKRVGKKWKEVEKLPFNDDAYSCGHPALTADGKTMVFVSDIPGGFGGTDLYLSKFDGKNWGTPVNLGSSINTQGDEEFPYLHPAGALFFSSNGHPGMGGLDVFAASQDGDRWSNPVNAGYPLNSSRDDFGIVWTKGQPKGYFSSNRGGNDDIYTFKRQMFIEGTVVDSRTNLPLENAQVSIMDAGGREQKVTTDKSGNFKVPASWGKEYFCTVNKDEYIQLRQKLDTKDVNALDDLKATLPLERDMIFTLSGNVKDAATGKSLRGAKIRVVSYREQNMKTDKKGDYFQELEENTEYTVIIMKDGYIPQLASLTTVGKTDPEDFVINADLEKGDYLLAEGRTFIRETGKALDKVTVRSIDTENSKEVKSTMSRTDGRFWVVLDPKVEQILIGSKVGYFSSRGDLPLPSEFNGSKTVQVEIPMVPYEIGALVKIIYYDYNKSDITKIAGADLFEIIYFLQENPEASVDLSSYTDSRGGDSYNMKLSKQRSDASVGFIVNRGVEDKRIKAKGFGETKPVNACTDGKKCSEEEHSLNRRTEIRVTELDLGKVDQLWKRQMILDQLEGMKSIAK